jgi:hypothetical protein
MAVRASSSMRILVERRPIFSTNPSCPCTTIRCPGVYG